MDSAGNSLDAYAPAEMARRVEDAAVIKAEAPALKTLTLSILAGAFIAFGAMFFTLVVTGSDLGFGPQRFLGGIAFSLGLVLLVVGGAELFTGDNLTVMAWADRRVRTRALARLWVLVYIGNFIGALGTAVLMWLSGALGLGDNTVATTAVSIAATKAALPVGEAFVRGILCNTLVCLAVWLCFAARRVSGKILAIVFPVSAFVALGFEHSVANMYLIPIGILAANDLGTTAPTVGAFLHNLVPVTVGNIVGGGVFVAFAYYLVYLRGRARH